MKITQFKKMLSLHGADFSRWEGADAEEIKAFLSSSEEAKTLHREAQALDKALGRFTVEPVNPAVLAKVMDRIGAPAGNATVHEFKPKAPPALSRPVFWGGAAAMAAAIVLFIGAQAFYVKAPAPRMMAVVADSSGPEASQLYATLDTMAEEEVAEQELIGLLAETVTPPGDEEIDRFLDELFDPQEGETVPDDLDLWLSYVAGQTQEL